MILLRNEEKFSIFRSVDLKILKPKIALSMDYRRQESNDEIGQTAFCRFKFYMFNRYTSNGQKELPRQMIRNHNIRNVGIL